MNEQEEKLRDVLLRTADSLKDYMKLASDQECVQFGVFGRAKDALADVEALLAEPQPGPIVTVTHGALPGCTAEAVARSGKWQTFEQPAPPSLSADLIERIVNEETIRVGETRDNPGELEPQWNKVADRLNALLGAAKPTDSTLADRVSILRTTCDAHISTIEDMQEEKFVS